MQPPQQPEKPVYILHQSTKRAIIPKAISLLALGILFYLGILINLSLLELSAAEETSVKTVSLMILLLVIAVGIFVAFHRAHLPYLFYRNRIRFNKRNIYYLNITESHSKKDLWDKLFRTHSLNLGVDFHIRNIPRATQLHDYLQQMIAYAQRKQQSTPPQ